MHTKKVACTLVRALLVASVMFAIADRAEARQGRVDLVKMSALTAAAVNPSCCPAAQPCFPAPCIRYVDRTCKRVCCGDCKPPVETVLKVVNPITCCPVDVPVCLPACCDGCPTVNSRCGLLCRGVVTYDWCCGYRVVVRFDRCGDVTVVYRG